MFGMERTAFLELEGNLMCRAKTRIPANNIYMVRPQQRRLEFAGPWMVEPDPGQMG